MSYFDKIKDRAIFIRLPKGNNYLQYDIGNIIDFPIVDDSYFYKGWKLNEHHYTTKYHREIFLPKLNEIFNFGLDLERDFHVVENYYNDFDISMPFPNKDVIYDVFSYLTNEYNENYKYSDFVNADGKCEYNTEFHKLYKYAHKCSRIINKTSESNRKILIDGDSQMIPSIMPLSVYFKEVWYFDNRSSKSLEKELDSCEFTDVLVQFNFNYLNKYIENLK